MSTPSNPNALTVTVSASRFSKLCLRPWWLGLSALVMVAGGGPSALADTYIQDAASNSNARSIGAVLDQLVSNLRSTPPVSSGISHLDDFLKGELQGATYLYDAYVVLSNPSSRQDVLTEARDLTNAFLRAVNPGPAYAGMASASLQRSLAVTAALDAHLENLAAAGGSDSAVSFGVGQVKNSPSMLTPSGNKMEHKGSDWTSWASGFVTRGTTDADEENGIGKAKNRDRGGSVGVETKIGNLRVGGMFAAGRAEAKFDDIVTVDTDHWHAGAYGSVALGSVTVDASAIYGSADNKSRRNDGLDDLEGKFSSRDFQAGVGVAVNVLPVDSSWEVTPIARVKYINYSQEAFEETSLNGTGVPVSVDKFKEDKFISKVGLRLGYKAEVSRSVTLSTDGGAYWVHDYKTDGKAANLQLAGVTGSNFSAEALKQEADTASFNLGVQATFADEVTLRVSAQHDMGSHSKQSTGLVSVGVSF